MAIIYLDKGTEYESTIPVSDVLERVLYNTINGSKVFDMGRGEKPVAPHIKDRVFKTIEIVSDAGDRVPIMCEYNFLKSFTTKFDEMDNTFTYTIDIGYESDPIR